MITRFLLLLCLGLNFLKPTFELPREAQNPSPDSLATAQTSSFACGYQTTGSDLLTQTQQESWVTWISQLSGEEPVTVADQEVTIATRSSAAMFSGQENARAYAYVLQSILAWYPASQIEEDEFFGLYPNTPWKNLILTIPGQVAPQEIVILSAHLDSTSLTPLSLAPGADDNASGTAALLEAARLFQSLKFERTIQLIWFTGEEQGMLGSKAYVQDHDVSQVQGVINLDMFSYDADGDRCFEMHVGVLPQSDEVGSCLAETINAYQLDLSFDYFASTQATSSSDHSSFWSKGVGAVEISENFYSYGTTGGCSGVDRNPNYHKAPVDGVGGDTLANMHPDMGFSIVQMALLAATSMAVPYSEPPPIEWLYQYFPFLRVDP